MTTSNMPESEVISNTSPLLNLGLIDRLDLLTEQFSTVKVPEQVWAELMAGEDAVQTVQSLRERNVLDVVSVSNTPLLSELQRELDRGEAATIAYAIRSDAELVLLDEREARQAAKRHDLTITGAIGILLRAAEDGDVSLQAELDALREAGFWISDDLYNSVLDRAEGGS
jgi:predicted nucleic acid-binding protein